MPNINQKTVYVTNGSIVSKDHIQTSLSKSVANQAYQADYFPPNGGALDKAKAEADTLKSCSSCNGTIGGSCVECEANGDCQTAICPPGTEGPCDNGECATTDFGFGCDNPGGGYLPPVAGYCCDGECQEEPCGGCTTSEDCLEGEVCCDGECVEERVPFVGNDSMDLSPTIFDVCDTSGMFPTNCPCPEGYEWYPFNPHCTPECENPLP
jgi:hypothetical protein